MNSGNGFCILNLNKLKNMEDFGNQLDNNKKIKKID
jgi:hypothetical protein